MNNRLKFPVTVLTAGIAGFALVTAACAVYKVINNRNRSENDSEKGINVRTSGTKWISTLMKRESCVTIMAYRYGL